MERLSKPRIPWIAAVPAAVVLTALIGLLVLWCQPNDLEEVLTVFREKPVLWTLDFLPVGLLLCAGSFICGNVFSGGALTVFLAGGLSIANCVKIQVRDEPLFPRDLGMWREVGEVVGEFHMDLPLGAIAAVLLSTAVLTALGVLIRTGPCPIRPLRGWRGRVLGGVLSAAVLWALTVTVYADMDLYNGLGASDPYHLSVVFNENGFPYDFLHHATTYLVDRPEGYRRSEAQGWDEAETDPGVGAAVDVIVVMDEAFSDITDDPAFAFPEEDDPLRELHAIQDGPRSISLRLVVPGFAGGTANTEFDAITGMQTNSLGVGTTSAMRTVDRDLDSLFRVFAADGYRTSFFHPGDDWFYNRENVYRWFGTETTRFIDEMEDPQYKGRWVTDAYLAGLIEEEIETAASEGRSLFHWTTTIQDHMGYPLSKYGEGYEYPHVPTAVPISEDYQNILDVYVEGVRDADAMLGELRAYLEGRERPSLLVFFGDHLPYLGDDRSCYAALGMDIARPDGEREDWSCIYETPCVIWANDAAATVLDWDAAVESLDLPESGKLSAAFLGPLLLGLTGRGRVTAWDAFLDGLRREVPVVQKNVWELADGTVVDQEEMEGTELAAKIAQWRKWTYYKLEQKEIP